MTEFAGFSFDDRIRELKDELQGLAGYPDEQFRQIIREVGFECNLCGKCCTRDFNDHAFLLDADAALIRDLDEAALVPAPYYELCDQEGTFYVSGYAIRSRRDGTCHFLEKGRCRIYAQRPQICRIYPYSLHREEDDQGVLDWRQISGLNRHGTYYSEIGDEESLRIAREVKAYEEAFLRQEIAFLEAIKEQIQNSGLKLSHLAYQRQMRLFERGGKVRVKVFHAGRLIETTVTKRDY